MGGHRQIDIRVLGPLDVRCGGRPVAIPGAKPRAILAVLALHAGHVVTAEVLAEILWGLQPPRTAWKALQTHVSALRRCLRDDAVQTSGSGWMLTVDTTDAARFEAAVRTGREAVRTGRAAAAAAAFTEALDAWRGQPELPDTARGRSEVIRWVEEHDGVLDDCIDALLACGKAAEVIGDLEASVAAAPLREHRWCQLMLALYRVGRQADALTAYRRARSLLTEQLGVEPGPELRELESAILANDPSLVVKAETPVPEPPARDLVAVPREGAGLFVGRRAEMRRLCGVLTRAARGEPAVVIISGNAGIGKTRLVQEATASLTDLWQVAVGHCVEAGESGLPYAPLAGILGAIAETSRGAAALAEAGRTEPGLLPLVQAGEAQPAVDTTSGLAQLRLFDALVRLLRRLTEQDPLMVVFEDLHWADGSTRAFLSFLCRNLVPQPLAVLLTVRTDELHRKHPLRPLLAELGFLPAAERIEVGPLATGELGELLAHRHGAPLPSATIRGIAKRSGGNPFFAEQLWTVGADDPEARPPVELADVLLHRVDRLGAEAQHLLKVASLAGQDIDHDVLLAVADRTEADVAAALRECADSRMFEPTADGTGYQFGHALLAEVIAADVLPPERRAVHARYADVLAGRASAAVVARHCLGAADRAGAFAWSIDAASEASSIAAPDDALAHWERVLQLWPHGRTADQERVGSRSEVALRASRAADHAGVMTRAIELARIAIDTADEPQQRARARLALAPLLTPLVTGERDEEVAVATAAIEEAGDDRKLVTRGRFILARAHLLAGRFAEAIPLADAVAVEGDQLRLANLALGGRATAYLARCQLGETDHDEESWLAQSALGGQDVETALWVLTRLADWWWPTDPARGERLAATAYDYAVANGVRTSIRGVWARETLVMCRWLTGSWDAVEDLANTEPVPINDATAAVVALESLVDIARGRLDFARRRLESAAKATTDALSHAFIAIATIDLNLAVGDPSAAVATCVDSLASLPPPSGFADLEAILVSRAMNALADAADEGVRIADPAALLAAADRVEQRARAAPDPRLSDTPIAVMRAHRSRLDGGDVSLWQAALQRRAGAPFEEARCRFYLAKAQLAAADTRAAGQQLALAAQTCRDLDAVVLLRSIETLAARTAVR